MNATTSSPAVRRRGLCAALGFALLSLAAAPGLAQATGTIAGSVSNSATGQNLEGAEVTLSPGDQSTLTSRDGRFVLSGVAPGTYTLTARYSGLDPKTLEARVTADGTATYDLGLTSSVYQLEKFVVEGEREGNALALEFGAD